MSERKPDWDANAKILPLAPLIDWLGTHLRAICILIDIILENDYFQPDACLG